MYQTSDWSLALGHHGYQRACDLVSGQASNGPLGSPVYRMRREDRTPISFHPLADLGGQLNFFQISRDLKLTCFKGAAAGQNAPCNPRQLVSERDCKDVAV